ncbi:MAG: hypothetical protein J07HR59_00996 [Halorubrum sp. J07HR59]|nr:MAG: hypothetical protein J07HR59_00996 [Halorubrum sp. J07HR59]
MMREAPLGAVFPRKTSFYSRTANSEATEPTETTTYIVHPRTTRA